MIFNTNIKSGFNVKLNIREASNSSIFHSALNQPSKISENNLLYIIILAFNNLSS